MSVFDNIIMNPHHFHDEFHRRLFMTAALRQMSEYQIPEELDCEVELLNKDLWMQFHSLGTEMIITKTGRRMFPSLSIRVHGLKAGERYGVSVEMCPLGSSRWTRSKGKWGPADGDAGSGAAVLATEYSSFLHPDSPATADRWSHPVYFNRLKLTNNPGDRIGNVVLSSMYRYQPRIKVFRVGGPRAAEKYFVFPETEFIAVTAYQNNCITQLKIDTNPFAKGFRKCGKGKRKLREESPSQDKKPCFESSTPDRLSSPEYPSSGSPSSSTSSSREEYQSQSFQAAVPLNPGKYMQMKQEIMSYMHMEMAQRPFRPAEVIRRPLRPVEMCRDENRIKGSSFTIRAILGEH